MPSEQKVIFCDIDDVLTFDRVVEGKKTRVVNRKAVTRIKKLVNKGYKVAFVTGKAADYVQRTFIPVLREFGIAGKCLVYGEHGFYQIKGNQVLMISKAAEFLRERSKLVAEIKVEAKKKGISFSFPTEETKQVMLYFKVEEPSPQNKQRLREAIQQAIVNQRARKELSHEIVVNLTRSGCDVFPATTSKANAVADALKKWGLIGKGVRGRAYGDMPVDRKLAPGPKIRFYLITGKSQHFLKETSFLGLRFFGRKMRGHIVAKERRMPKPVRKAMKTLRKRLPK